MRSRRTLEICTFELLKKSVQDIDKRDFTLRHLQQMVAVEPHAFRLGWIFKAGRYHLTVDFESLRSCGDSAGAGACLKGGWADLQHARLYGCAIVD